MANKITGMCKNCNNAFVFYNYKSIREFCCMNCKRDFRARNAKYKQDEWDEIKKDIVNKVIHYMKG